MAKLNTILALAGRGRSWFVLNRKLARQQSDAMVLDDIGEFGLIARISDQLGAYSQAVVAGIGDDTAVLRCSPRKLLLATCDIQVEGVHFLMNSVSPHFLGRRALAVNVSDIAAMGGVPRHALVSLGLPSTTSLQFVDELYAGLRAEAECFGIDIVGGNVSSSRGCLFVDVTLIGEVEPEQVLYRSGAQVGDRVIVTGWLGDSAGGLQCLLNPLTPIPPAVARRLKLAHQQPRPRVSEGRIIAASGLAHAMIDISDGLASDLGHVAEASGVGAVVFADQVPISRELREVAQTLDRDPLDLALFGGEDYQLLATVDAESAGELADTVTARTGTPVSVIGEIRPAEAGVRLRRSNGEEVVLATSGFRHF